MANDFSVPDTNGETDRPSSQLDIYSDAIDTTVDDELLEKINLGLGNYSDKEYWQQVESFKMGLYADEAFGRRIVERAVEETKRELALQGTSFWDENDESVVKKDGWEDLPEEERERLDRRRYIEQRGEEIWDSLTEQAQLDALGEAAGMHSDWTSPHHRMMMMRHEASRSKGARLLDNLFGRVKEVKGESSDMAKERLKR